MYQTTLPPTTEHNSQQVSGLESALTWESTSDFRPSSTCRLTAQPSVRSRRWNGTSEPSATMSKTTGRYSFPWQNFRTTTQCMLWLGWHHSGPCTIRTLQCSSNHWKRHIQNQRTKQMQHSRDRQRRLGLSLKTYLHPRNATQCTRAQKKLHSMLGKKAASWQCISGRPGHLRSSIRNAWDRILWVKSSMGALTTNTLRRRCGMTMISTSQNAIGKHYWSHTSHQMILMKWLSTTQKNGMSMAFMTPNTIIGSFIISFNGPSNTDISMWDGNRRITTGMLRSWWLNSIDAILGSCDSGGKGSIWCSFILFFCLSFFSSLWLDAVQYKWPWDGFYHLWITFNWRWSLPMRRIRKTIMRYVSCLFVCLFLSVCSYTA